MAEGLRRLARCPSANHQSIWNKEGVAGEFYRTRLPGHHDNGIFRSAGGCVIPRKGGSNGGTEYTGSEYP